MTEKNPDSKIARLFPPENMVTRLLRSLIRQLRLDEDDVSLSSSLHDQRSSIDSRTTSDDKTEVDNDDKQPSESVVDEQHTDEMRIQQSKMQAETPKKPESK